ncbi:uncharacterized protein LOC144124854 isoform X1 [Amblyomma americanum]
MFFGLLLILLFQLMETRSESCTPLDSLFDKGLRKVLRSDRFVEITLPDFLNSEPEQYGFSIGFSDGTLCGLNTIQRRGHAFLNVDNSGSQLSLHVQGGPISVRYDAGFNSSFLRHKLGVVAHVAQFRASFTAEEPSPNHLRLEVYGLRMSRIRLHLNNVTFSGGVYDYVIDYLRPYIERKVGQLLARELRNMAVQTLKAVKVYAASNEENDIFAEESQLTRAWRKALGSASSYLALIRGQHPGRSSGGGTDEDSTPRRRLPERQREPRSAEVERERGVFDSCLRTLVLSTSYDPTPLPHDLEEFTFSFGRVVVSGGNVTGLSSVHRSGDCAVMLGECGAAIRMDLGFEDLTIKAAAIVEDDHHVRNAVFDVRVPAVEVALDVTETNNQFQIMTYRMAFTAPVTLTELPPGRRSLEPLTNGISELTLREEDLELLKISSRKYIQRLIQSFEHFVSDPPLLEP